MGRNKDRIEKLADEIKQLRRQVKSLYELAEKLEAEQKAWKQPVRQAVGSEADFSPLKADTSVEQSRH